MIIYRCENINCAKDFTKPEDLKEVHIVVGAVGLDYALCDACCEKLKAHVKKFFDPEPKPAQEVAVAG